jgi:hypothetical protein
MSSQGIQRTSVQVSDKTTSCPSISVSCRFSSSLSYTVACTHPIHAIYIIIQLYRDCFRLIKHISPGASSPKSQALRRTVRSEFRKPYETNVQLENAKQNAIRALSNYMLATAAPKDPTVGGAMKDYYKRTAKEAKQEQQDRQQQQSVVMENGRKAST